MARRRSPTTAASTFDEAFRADARDLCELLGWPQTWEGRVGRIFGRIAGEFPPPQSAAEVESSVRAYIYELVQDAVATLSAERALDLFEKQDIAVLVRRIETVNYLLDAYTPFYTHKELANHLNSFLDFLGRHQDFMIRTGLPPECFRPSPWLNAHLGRLYDTRVSEPPYLVSDKFSNTSADKPPYRWFRSVIGKERCQCEYDDADFLPGMARSDGFRVEELRRRFLEAKATLIDRMAKAVRKGSVDRLWDDCIAVLSNAFRAEDVQFLFRMDLLSLRHDLQEEWHAQNGINCSPGGLTNLLLVIGHVEKELTFKTLAVAKEALVDSRAFSAKWDESIGTSHTYLRLLGKPGIRRINRALDNVARIGDQEEDFWREFRRRVLTDCRREFQATVDLVVPGKYRDRIAPLLIEEARQASARLERGDPLLQLDGHDQNVNSFRYDGQCWTIQFEGPPFTLPNSKGLFYVHYLLREQRRNPGQPVPATTLKLARMQFDRLSGTAEQAAAAAEISDDHMSASPASDSGNLLDPAAWAGVQQQYHQFICDLAEAERENDRDEISRIKDEMQHLARYISEAVGPDGQVRKIGDQKKKDSKAVGNAIRRALESIEQRSPTLCRHLSNSIKIGTFCSYQPDRVINWVT